MSQKKEPRSVPNGMTRQIVSVAPATSFDFRYDASGVARVIHLERGALEAQGAQGSQVLSFRTNVDPGERPINCGFYTSPDSIQMTAQATILIENSASGDSIICQSLGSWNGLAVTLTVVRENPDGSMSQILQETIQDANEHAFVLP